MGRSYATLVLLTSTNVKFTGPHVSVAIACAKLGVELQVIAEAGNCAMVGAVVSVTFIVIVGNDRWLF
jgi:hypothetical protein